MANESSSFPFTGLAILALFVSTTYMAQVGFDQFRQAEPETVKRKALQPGTIDARLWEDPLAALQRHRELLRERCPAPRRDQVSSASTPPASGVSTDPQDARCIQAIPPLPASFASGRSADHDSTGPALNASDTVIAVLLPGAPFVGAEEARRRMRYAVLSGLAAEGFVPFDSERIRLLRMRVCTSLSGERCRAPPASPAGSATLSPATPAAGSIPFVDVPYEILVPDRQASVSPLTASRHLNPQARIVVLWVDDSALGSRWLTALATLFDELSGKEAPRPALRILGPNTSGGIVPALRTFWETRWIDDSALGSRWLTALASLFDELSGKEAPRPALRILGPNTSGGIVQALRDLREMKEETARSDPIATSRWNTLSRARMISPAATAPESLLLRESGTSESPSLRDAFGITLKPYERNNPERPANETPARTDTVKDTGFFVRTIATDDRLIKSLVDELRARGLCDTDYTPAGRVALLAEWDSTYARHFSTNLEKQLSCTDKAGTRRSHVPVTTYRYLRGLDGFTVEGPPSGPPRQGAQRSSTEQSAPVEWPEGRDQRDYLRRLVTERLSQEQDANALATPDKPKTRKPLLAIGIIGSDVHDKLLLAQAVREAFDDRVLFTTDLDARLLHPKVTPHTRNLIVATSLPLLPPPALAGQTAPFRDTYQTALFLASRIAATASGEERPDCSTHPQRLECRVAKALQRPYLYEIGRTGITELRASDVDPEELGRRRIAALFGVCLLLVLGAVMILGKPGPAMQAARGYWADRHRRRSDAGVLASAPQPDLQALAILAGLQVAILAFAGGVLVELALPDKVGLRGCAVLALTSAALFWLLIFPGAATGDGRQPHRTTPAHAGTAAWFVGAALLAACAWALSMPPWRDVHEPFALLEGISAWPSQIVRTFVLVLFFWFLDHAWCNTANAAAEIGHSHFLFSGADHTTLSRAEARRSLASRVEDLSVWLWRPSIRVAHPDGTIDGAALWAEYQHRLRNGPRLLRLGLWFFVLGALLCAVSLSLDGTALVVPARGEGDRLLFEVTVWATALALALLLTVVADGTVLTWRLLGLLRRGRTTYPQQTVERFASELGDELAAQATVSVAATPTPGRAEGAALRNTLLDDWINMRLIEKHSAAMGPQILLPFVLLALLLVARSRLFDNWHLGEAVMATFCVLIVLAIVNAALLKHGAERSRSVALKRMEADLLWLKGAGPGWSALAEHYPALIDQVRNMKSGAFAPLLEQPLLRAALVPLGGAGGIQLLDLLLFAR